MDETLIKPSCSGDQGRLVMMNEIEVRPTEIGYVTSTNLEYGTFFVQQCKHTNASLMRHNKLINDYCKLTCNGAKTSPENVPKKVQVGDVFCARFPTDANWYRAVVKTCDDAKRVCQIYFVDYGDYLTVSYDDLMQVSPQDLPAMEHTPFGFHCSVKGSKKFGGDVDTKHLLSCLMNTYIMVKAQERLDTDHWCIDLPIVAYNTLFWIAYNAGKAKGPESTNADAMQAASINCA